MRSTRIRIATALVGLVAAVSMAAPASADSSCGKLDPTCQKLEHLVCILLRRCF